MTPDQLKMLLEAGVKHGASDIHFRVDGPPTYRVRGQLAPLKYDRLTAADTLAICQLIVRDPEKAKSLSELQEYDTSYHVPGIARFRVNIHRQRGSLSLVLRIIPTEIPTVAASSEDPVRSRVTVTGARTPWCHGP